MRSFEGDSVGSIPTPEREREDDEWSGHVVIFACSNSFRNYKRGRRALFPSWRGEIWCGFSCEVMYTS